MLFASGYIVAMHNWASQELESEAIEAEAPEILGTFVCKNGLERIVTGRWNDKIIFKSNDKHIGESCLIAARCIKNRRNMALLYRITDSYFIYMFRKKNQNNSWKEHGHIEVS